MNTDELRKDMYHKIGEILVQVKKTNGRVSRLEAWRDQCVGGMKAMIIITALIGFLFKIGWINIGV
tara:strand:- start:146 stop:343 length:198 start_codon:yes stop_codon:yes gene_type:complete